MPRPMKRCAGCGERMNPNAFPRGGSLCYPCSDKRKAERARRMGSRDRRWQY